MRLLLRAVDFISILVDSLGRLIVLVEHLRVFLRSTLRLVHVLLELDLEGVVEGVNLLYQVHLHGLGLFDILVTSLLLLSQEIVLDRT